MRLQASHAAAGVTLAIALGLAGLSACGSSGDGSRLDRAARPVTLPGGGRQIDFDDIVYSTRLGRVLVPARESGLYVVEPRSATASRLGGRRNADSVDAGGDRIFVADRQARRVDVLDARTGRVVASVPTGGPPDYVRYVRATDELWVTEPAATPSGIEIFASSDAGPAAPRRSGFVRVPDGPEGLAWSAARGAAYVHAGSDVVRIDLASRRVTARWATGCDGTHGFPQVDDRDGLLLAGCAADGEVRLLDLDHGRRLGRYAVGGGEALQGYSPSAKRFYVRADPGDTVVALAASRSGLARLGEVKVPLAGHCLTADSVGHYWTCDARAGRVLRFNDR